MLCSRQQLDSNLNLIQLMLSCEWSIVRVKLYSEKYKLV